MTHFVLRVIMAVAMAWTSLPALQAVTRDYDAIAVKAARFFKYREWANAAAQYELMIEDRPQVADNYCRAIVVAAMRRLPDYEISLVERAQQQLVPVDTLFAGVRRISFSIGQSSLYEHFLIRLKERQPWQGRIIDKQLLDYYAFRSNGPRMIEYSAIMLRGAPENIKFLEMQARGYMLEGKTDEAMAIYQKILELHPDNYNALLELGNYYYLAGNNDKATGYLQQACDIRRTPYVDQLLVRLKDPETRQ